MMYVSRVNDYTTIYGEKTCMDNGVDELCITIYDVVASAKKSVHMRIMHIERRVMRNDSVKADERLDITIYVDLIPYYYVSMTTVGVRKYRSLLETLSNVLPVPASYHDMRNILVG